MMIKDKLIPNIDYDDICMDMTPLFLFTLYIFAFTEVNTKHEVTQSANCTCTCTFVCHSISRYQTWSASSGTSRLKEGLTIGQPYTDRDYNRRTRKMSTFLILVSIDR